MKYGLEIACEKTGFVREHGIKCLEVANNLRNIIIFREPGPVAEELIMDGYAQKGFRIDTKSCNWGPMAGFVCVDPRLTKDPSYIDKNVRWTVHALSGHIVEEFFGSEVRDPLWKAAVMPIVISLERILSLANKGIINPRTEGNDIIGESIATKGRAVLPWRLVPVGNARNPWLKVDGQFPKTYNINEEAYTKNYYVVCVNKNSEPPFIQEYPLNYIPCLFRGHETILGLTNPETESRGFKGCVTADYDLFAIWGRAGEKEMLSLKHKVNIGVIADYMIKHGQGGSIPSLPSGVARMQNVDNRLKLRGFVEHYRFGDVSGRIMYVKAALNTALFGGAGLQGGNAIHHNDEAGNFALAKGKLEDCFPLIAFFPGQKTLLIEDLEDFKDVVLSARASGYKTQVKPAWLREAGI